MSLNMEYGRKISRFIEVIPKRMYSFSKSVSFKGFITRERISFEDACAHEKQEYIEGIKWGKKWEYGWFFTEVIIPESCKGERVVFKAELGECLVWVNGKVYGSLDREHDMVTLAESAKGGEHFEIVMEVYAGHVGYDGIPNTTNVLPCTTVVMPEENMTEFSEDVEQKTVKNGEIGIFHEDLFQFWMDMRTLFELRDLFGETSWRQANIDKCLQKVCDAVDIEAKLPILIKSAVTARGVMAPLLACKNGTSAPTMFAIGNSHLDLEWLWTKEETRRKAARTLGNQLRLLEEYDDYKYVHSQPWLLETVKNEYPELYKEIKKWAKKGRIVVEGGMWVEADTNIPAGESLIRQFLFGKRFMSEEFGVDSEILWLPDVFGISAVIPQIMIGCGVKYLLHAKIPFQYNGGDTFPHNNFIWQGLDGTEVLAHITHGYATGSSPNMIMNKWNSNAERADVPAKLFMYGHGDGGGGATRIHQEFIKREYDLEGLPKVKMAAPKEFFAFVENECEISKKYQGELYYTAHRGTYTSQAETKRLGRQSERALREAEMWTALLSDRASVIDELKPLWKEVLFNHFHDVIPGSSLTEAYTRAEKSFSDVIEKAGTIADRACFTALKDTPDTLTVFNSLSFERKVFAILPTGYQGAYNGNGIAAETQCVNGQTLALLEVPACGMSTYTLQRGDCIAEAGIDNDLYLENNLIRAKFNAQGELISVIDKESGVEFLTDSSNRFRVYQDAPTMFDAWDIDSFYEKLEVTNISDIAVAVEQRGNLLSSLLIKKKINNSEIKQHVILRKDSKRIDFETEVDWNETHKLLKVDFNTNIHTTELLSEIQFGYVMRPTHRNRQYDADRFEVWQHKWSALAEGNRGVAILNDCKYGISADGGRMSLTLLKSAAAPALHADKGVHKFTYSVMPFTQTFFNSRVIQEAYDLNYPAHVMSGEGTEGSLLQLSEKNIIIETVKFAEDGSGDLIIRLYECQNAYTNCRLTFGFDVKEVYETDMLEHHAEKDQVHGNQVTLVMKPFEIKTLRVIK